MTAEEIKKYRSEYYKKNAQKLRDANKVYRTENKEKVKKYQDEYYQKNKVKIAARKKAKYEEMKRSSGL